MLEFLEVVNRMVWGPTTIGLILMVGLMLSIRTRFGQIRFLPAAVRKMLEALRGGGDEKNVTPVQALCTALAATAGTGNLVGVAGAIALGGPGSIFWMWICGIIGMMIKFAEATLSVCFRRVRNGQTFAGPMYMIQYGMRDKWYPLAVLYALLGLVASFGIGNAAQINAVIVASGQAAGWLGLPFSVSGRIALGFALGLLVAVVLSGGAKRIGNAAEFLVPAASFSYIALCFWALWLRRGFLPAAFRSIFTGAFSPGAVTGGVIGSAFQAMRIGVCRGVFTNEAGLGTAAMAHGGADVCQPAEQGLFGILEVFLDTIVICTMTALVILSSGVSISYGTDSGAVLTVQAFSAVCGDWVRVFLALFLAVFAFATILGWGLYGIRCGQFLFGEDAVRYIVVAQSAMVLLGAMVKTDIIWSLSEVFNGLMAIPNLIALIALRNRLVTLTSEFERKRGKTAAGGTYENFYQCKPLPALSYEKVPSPRAGSQKTGQENLSSEYRPA